MNKYHAELKETARAAIGELFEDQTVDTFETADDLRELIDFCYDRINSMGARADRPKKKGRKRA